MSKNNDIKIQPSTQASKLNKLHSTILCNFSSLFLSLNTYPALRGESFLRMQTLLRRVTDIIQRVTDIITTLFSEILSIAQTDKVLLATKTQKYCKTITIFFILLLTCQIYSVLRQFPIFL